MRTVAVATLSESDGPAMFPFSLLDVVDEGGCRALSVVDWIEFCLTFVTVGRPPLAGGGETRVAIFTSGKLLCVGEDAQEGDFAFTLEAALC